MRSQIRIKSKPINHIKRMRNGMREKKTAHSAHRIKNERRGKWASHRTNEWERERGRKVCLAMRKKGLWESTRISNSVIRCLWSLIHSFVRSFIRFGLFNSCKSIRMRMVVSVPMHGCVCVFAIEHFWNVLGQFSRHVWVLCLLIFISTPKCYCDGDIRFHSLFHYLHTCSLFSCACAHALRDQLMYTFLFRKQEHHQQ